MRPAGRDAHQRVRLRKTYALQVAPAFLIAVLRAFYGTRQGKLAPGNEALYQPVGHPVGGRAFRRVQHAKPTGRARAAVDQTAPGGDFFINRVHSPRNMWNFLLHRPGHLPVLAINEPEHAFRAFPVDMRGAWIDLLGIDSVELYHAFSLSGLSP